MEIIQFLETLTFGELFIVILTILLPIVGVAIFAIKKGIKTKFFTIFRPSPINSKKDIILLLEAIKLKDDIRKIDTILFQQEKKIARYGIAKAQEIQLKSFGEIINSCKFEKDATKHRDYLYYNLLSERMYREIFNLILDSLEKNGLSNKYEKVSSYAKFKSDSVLRDGLQIVYSFYNGIEEIDRKIHDAMIAEIYSELLESITNIYEDAIIMSRKAQCKKNNLKEDLFSKATKIDNISQEQLKLLFNEIGPEDFLD